MSEKGDIDKFKKLLDDQNDWPAVFTFKFIVPSGELARLETMLDGHELTKRPSRKGNYIAVTLSPVMDSSDAVMHIYATTSVIEGIVSL